jgi:uroporphyrinogen III methyltransferase/synthase
VTVYLVGAGPGDPGLVTVRGAELLRRADVVVHDRLSARSLLDLAPPEAVRIDVGKRAGHGPDQAEINELLARHGRGDTVVVRLKGGDPFVFARGGEEAAHLHHAGVPYEVVPGVTSAIAVPAYAGIPVTRRYSSTSFTVITGHEDPTKEVDGVDWRAAAQLGGTIVVLMGVAHIGEISARLLDGGLPPDTPAAAVRRGTTPRQHTTVATLATIAEQDLQAPSVIVIGEVARDPLGWFHPAPAPLAGMTVVNPRAREQASQLTTLLEAQGATVVEMATLSIEDPDDGGAALRAAAASTADHDWVVLTSANAARRFLDAVGDARRLGSVQLAAIGPGTAAVLAERFLQPDLVPSGYVAEAMVEAFPDPPADRPGSVLLPRAAVARDVIPDGLRAKGWTVEVVDAYRTVTAPPDEATLAKVAGADAVTFTASSTVTRFLELAGRDRVPGCVVAIGPITAATARDADLDVTVEAQEHSLEGMVAALVAWRGGQPPR